MIPASTRHKIKQLLAKPLQELAPKDFPDFSEDIKKYDLTNLREIPPGPLTVGTFLQEVAMEMKSLDTAAKEWDEILDKRWKEHKEAMLTIFDGKIEKAKEHLEINHEILTARNFQLLMQAINIASADVKASAVEEKMAADTLRQAPKILQEALNLIDSPPPIQPRQSLEEVFESGRTANLSYGLSLIAEAFKPMAASLSGISRS